MKAIITLLPDTWRQWGGEKAPDACALNSILRQALLAVPPSPSPSFEPGEGHFLARSEDRQAITNHLQLSPFLPPSLLERSFLARTKH